MLSDVFGGEEFVGEDMISKERRVSKVSWVSAR
jgi:hypothetical protein